MSPVRAQKVCEISRFGARKTVIKKSLLRARDHLSTSIRCAQKRNKSTVFKQLRFDESRGWGFNTQLMFGLSTMQTSRNPATRRVAAAC